MRAFNTEYIAGWIAFKLKQKNKDYSASRREKLPSYVTDHTYAKYLGPKSNSWIDYLTYGGLTKPSQQLVDWVTMLEKEFFVIHGEDFGDRDNAMKGLVSALKSSCQQVPVEVIQVFSRFRIYARCRFLNKQKFEAAIIQRIEKRKANAIAAEAAKANVLSKPQHQTDDLSRSKNKKLRKIVR